MNTEEFLEKIGRLTNNIEEKTNIWCKQLNNYANDHKIKPIRKDNNILADGMQESEQLYNHENLKTIVRGHQKQIKKIKVIEDQEADLLKKIAELEAEKKKLESKESELSKRLAKLKNLKIVLKCIESIFPVQFAYQKKDVTGYMYNKETLKYYGFELPAHDNAGNTKYAWKLLEKLFSK